MLRTVVDGPRNRGLEDETAPVLSPRAVTGRARAGSQPSPGSRRSGLCRGPKLEMKWPGTREGLTVGAERLG